MTRIRLLAFVATAAFLAAAQPTARAAAPFVGMERANPGAALGLDANLGVPGSAAKDAGVDLFAHYQAHAHFGSGYGGYVTVPFSTMFASGSSAVGQALTFDSSTFAFGNVELGGFAGFDLGLIALTARAGVGLPTAQSSARAQFANGGAILAGRLTDLALTQPDTLPVRLSATARLDAAIVEVRADVGLDVLADVGDARDGTDTLVRANLGAALGLGLVTPSLELANLLSLSGKSALLGNRSWRGELIGGVTLNLPFVRPFVALTYPLDSAARRITKLGVTAGVRLAF